MREDLDQERQFISRQWAKRETQIRSAIDSTLSMVGDLRAIAGKAIPDIQSLERPLLEVRLTAKSDDWRGQNRTMTACIGSAVPRIAIMLERVGCSQLEINRHRADET
ncbi:hypothetical protein [Bradyrhizobium embrapense]|uniref:hypothetical protein n=1 Tax=Bradyrhizobium embrapense TaxID=630921 RepID=UPI00067D5EF1|nr:hypothetical protein [Bradyrhizobium embrapense]